jgi:hypothetical protein
MAESLESFYDNYVQAIREGNAAIFAGAGLSQGSGYVNWKGLLRSITTDLGLDIDRETDLIGIAQYHVNKFGSRALLNKAIIDEFLKDADLNENHRLIANLDIDTVWTTNYDKFIEQAFDEGRKRVDAKITTANLVTQRSGRGVVVYKMHGDVSQPDKAVITKEDYETYDAPDNRQMFSIKLKGDLVGKTFLFLGFSFTDPNIDYILARIRALLSGEPGIHYCVMRSVEKPKPFTGKRKANYEYEKTKLEHRIADLKRYGIRPVFVERYSEITDILRELNRRSHLKDVFISGSASQDYGPLGQDRVEGLARLLGRRIIKGGCNLVSGIGVGIGSHVIIGALESLYSSRYEDQGDRLTLRPFPQSPPTGMTLSQFWQRYRNEMISKAGVCIFVAGTKTEAGKVVQADGMMNEFDIAVAQKKYPVPIGATGHVARAIWNIVMGDVPKYFPQGGVKAHLEILGSEKKTNEDYADAVFAILGKIGAA